jgi:chromosomal replication initiation ATPase DnaA
MNQVVITEAIIKQSLGTHWKRWCAQGEAFVSEGDRILPPSALRPVAAAKVALNVDCIMKAVTDYFEVGKDLIIAKTRTASPTNARHVFFYLTRKHTKLTLPVIGRMAGRRDHSTVLSGAEKIATLLLNGDHRTVQSVAAIERMLGLTK